MQKNAKKEPGLEKNRDQRPDNQYKSKLFAHFYQQKTAEIY